MSKFERIPQDRYYTPFRPVVPLIPYIDHITAYAEPCAGPGQLVSHLRYFGKTCGYQNDLDHGVDARTDAGLAAAALPIITNPPYTWDVLSGLLTRFISLGETWLLLEMPFLCNGQSAPFLRHCSDVVPVGRIKWFEGTAKESNKDYGWFRFHPDHSSYPTCRPRRPVPRGITTSAQHFKKLLTTPPERFTA